MNGRLQCREETKYEPSGLDYEYSVRSRRHGSGLLALEDEFAHAAGRDAPAGIDVEGGGRLGHDAGPLDGAGDGGTRHNGECQATARGEGPGLDTPRLGRGRLRRRARSSIWGTGTRYRAMARSSVLASKFLSTFSLRCNL